MKRHAALGRPVELGEAGARHLGGLAEHTGLFETVLSGRGIEHEQHFVGRVGQTPGHDAAAELGAGEACGPWPSLRGIEVERAVRAHRVVVLDVVGVQNSIRVCHQIGETAI